MNSIFEVIGQNINLKAENLKKCHSKGFLDYQGTFFGRGHSNNRGPIVLLRIVLDCRLFNGTSVTSQLCMYYVLITTLGEVID